MFSYRGLLLIVTISLASIVFADYVQSGYEHLYDSNLKHQPVLQYQIHPPTEQYRADQLPESTRYTSGVQTMYPYYGSYEDNPRSNLLKLPYRPLYHHYSPKPHNHFAKIEDHGYVPPSEFVGSPYLPPVVLRYKRSDRSDPTSTEANKSETVAHDNDVATKSPLTDTKHPTAIDSLLPEHEPTDTNDKRVESRQIPLELYPEEYQLALAQMRDLFRPLLIDNPSLIQSPQQEETCNNDNQFLTINNPSTRVQFPFPSSEDDYRSAYRDAEEMSLQQQLAIAVLKLMISSMLKDYFPQTCIPCLEDLVELGVLKMPSMSEFMGLMQNPRDARKTNPVNTVNTAMPGQDESKIPTAPSNQNPNQPTYPSYTVPETSRVEPQTFTTENQYRKHKKILNPEDLIDSLSVRNGKGPNSYHAHYYPDSDKYSYYGTYFDVNKKSANSADSTNPGQFPYPPLIPTFDRVFHTNFNTWPKEVSTFPWTNEPQTNFYN